MAFRISRILVPLVLAITLTACQHIETTRSDATESTAKPAKKTASKPKAKAKTTQTVSTRAPAKPAPATPTPAKPVRSGPPKGKVAYSANYDAELRTIVDLAKQNRWEEADARASALYAMDPKDSAIARVYKWVQSEGPKRREKALEDQIGDVSTRGTRFNPTLESIITEKKSEGLPPRSELREAIEHIKETPYIPETFGKTIQAKGTLEDFRSEKGRMAKILDKEIEVHLDNVSLENIIFNVGQAEGINFVADKSIPAFQQKLSVNMKNAKLVEFLDYVSRNMGLRFQVGDDLIWITDGKDPTKLNEVTRFYRLRRGFILPAQFGISDAEKKTTTAPNNVVTVTEVQRFENFVRDGASRETSIEKAIKNFFTGKYQIDYERNTIMAQGTEDQLRLLEKIIETLDKPIQQVFIEARFITVTESTFLQLGVAWETGRNPLTSARVPTDYTGLAPAVVGAGLENTWFGLLSRKSLSATLTAIDQSGESETLSSPRLTLVNNLPATLRDGKNQFYYEEYKVNNVVGAQTSASSVVPDGKPVRLTSGVSLNVLASIGGDGRSIQLALNPEVSEDVQMVTFATVVDRDDQGRIASSFDIKLPQARKQSLATRVSVKSGQTVVMGGVLQREQRHFVEGVPVLSRIPLIGAAFRRRTEIDNPRYLLVFVTATLLAEDGRFILSPEAE